MIKIVCVGPPNNRSPPDEDNYESADIQVRLKYNANHPRYHSERLTNIVGGPFGYYFPMTVVVDTGKFRGHLLMSYIKGDPDLATAVHRANDLFLYMRMKGYGNVKHIRAGREHSGAKWIVSTAMAELCREKNITIEFIPDLDVISSAEHWLAHDLSV